MIARLWAPKELKPLDRGPLIGRTLPYMTKTGFPVLFPDDDLSALSMSVSPAPGMICVSHREDLLYAIDIAGEAIPLYARVVPLGAGVGETKVYQELQQALHEILPLAEFWSDERDDVGEDAEKVANARNLLARLER